MAFSTLTSAVDARIVQHLGRDAVVYTPGVGAAAPVRGVFDEQYVRARLGEPGVSTKEAVLFALAADLPSDPVEDTDARVTIDGAEYSIREVDGPDVHGALLLVLQKEDA